MPKITGDDEGGRILREIAKKVMDIFYPRRCVICDRALPVKEQFVCSACSDLLEYTGENYCMKCGRPVKEGEEYCSACKEKKTFYQSGRSLFLYNAAIRESISRFKYYGRQEYAAFYAKAMYQTYGEWMKALRPDALIPVPIHRRRYRERGFNQAEILAKELGKYSEIPVLTEYLIRVKHTLPQKELSEKERLKNLHQAFSVRSGSQQLYKNLNCVIIIDDIYTTGSTIDMCASVLRKEGVGAIHFLCISTGQGF